MTRTRQKRFHGTHLPETLLSKSPGGSRCSSFCFALKPAQEAQVSQCGALLPTRARPCPRCSFFSPLFLVGFASGFYHLAPDNGRLMWDRAAIALTLLAWLVAIFCERLDHMDYQYRCRLAPATFSNAHGFRILAIPARFGGIDAAV